MDSNPRTPATVGSNSSSNSSRKPTLADLKRQLSYNASSEGINHYGSLPSTPSSTRLQDLDPAIVLSVLSRNATLNKTESAKSENIEHTRSVSNATIVPLKQTKLEPGFSMTEKIRPDKTTLLERNWRKDPDPFFGQQDTSTTQASNAESSQSDKTDETELSETIVSEEELKSPTPRPREDRKLVPITAENAQGQYSPTYCLFVANLAVGCSDADLEFAVHQVFSQFGELYCKIRRDKSGMPYAFCQFTEDEAAHKALNHGHGLMIRGRPCRIERAKANRSVYLSRLAGGPISPDQARAILESTGAIEKTWYPSDTDKEIYRLSDGIWVTYAFFQDARDAQQSFRDNSEYRLEIPFSPEDHERALHGKFSKASPMSGPASSLRGSRSASSFKWPAVGRSNNCSIFVGNIPMEASMEEIREAFDLCGAVKTIEIIGKAQGAAPGFSAFCFVEFANDVGAKNALSREIRFRNRPLRIEPRESGETVTKSGFSISASPRTRLPMTPRTPMHNRTAGIKSAAATPSSMMPIYENGQQQAGGPQTPLHQQVYATSPYYYGSPHSASPFGTFYAGAQSATPSFGPVSGGQVMGQYAYPGYGQGYTFPYAVQGPVIGDASTEVNNNSQSTTQAVVSSSTDNTILTGSQ